MAFGGGSYVPSVDFFGALTGIGDTLAANRQEARDAELLGVQPRPSFIDRLVGAVSPQKPAQVEGAVTPVVSRETSMPTSGQALYDTLIAKGAHPNEAAMLAGEAGVESAYNPTTVHDQGTGYGLWGHRLDRLEAMRRATGTDRPSVEQQAEFALQELRSRPEYAKVLAARSPQELADAGMFYERPKGFTPENPRGGLNYNERLASIARFAGGAPVQVADASGRIPASVGAAPVPGPTGLPPANDATVALLKTFPPGLQTPEGIARAMQAGSPHVRAIAERAFNVYTQALANQATREQHQAEFNLRRQDMLANQAAKQEELRLKREEISHPYEKQLETERAKNAGKMELMREQAGRAGEMMLPQIDRAEKAYKKLAELNALGPLSASSPSRLVGGLMGSEAETARQDYEAAQKELELTKAQITMKGQGQISNSERRILSLTLPRLDAANASTGLRTLKLWRELAKRSIAEAKQGVSPPSSEKTTAGGLPAGWTVEAH